MNTANATRVAAMAFSLLVALSTVAIAQEENETLETVLVTGEQPGPGLWKVSKGENVLWILGSFGSLPSDMVWRSRELEARVAESQEVIYPGGTGIKADIGMFEALSLVPAALRASKNPDGAKLQVLLSPEAYAKWLVLKAKYIGKDRGIEKRRPMIVAEQLNDAVARNSGLGGGVHWQVNQIAKTHGVPITQLPTIVRVVEVDGLRKMLKGARKLDFGDAECLTTNLDRIEPHLGEMKIRANAWATGDIERLRREPGAPAPLNCSDVFMNALRNGVIEDVAGASAMLQQFDEAQKSAEKQWVDTWLQAAEAALTRNTSTVLVMDIGYVLAPAYGAIALLREKGYTVEEPN